QKILSLGDVFKQNFIQPLLTRSFSITESENTLVITKEGHLLHPETILQHLRVVVTFLTKFPQSILDLLIPNLTTSLTDVVNSFSFSSSLSIDDLPSFISLCTEVSKFNRFLIDSKWTLQGPLSDWSANESRIWYSARVAGYLISTRTIVHKEVLNQRNV